MPRLMYDSTSPWDIPRDAEMVAYYVDGLYAWPQSWLDMFPNAIKVGISAIGRNTAVVGDVEVGCIWPPRNAVPWVQRARRDGYDPTIYVNELNDWGPTRQAFRDAGEPEPHWWTARYNGVRQIPAGAIGRQFAHPHDGDGVANYPWETGKHYDLSIVADFWPGVDNGGPGGGGGGGNSMSEAIVRNGLAKWLKEDLVPGTDQRELLQALLAETLITVTPDEGEPWQDRIGDVIAAIDRRLARVEAKGAPVTMTPEDRAEIAKQVRGDLVEALEPLFALARRLES